MPTLETRDGRNLPAFSIARHLPYKEPTIGRFDREYHFLSNFYRVKITSAKNGLAFHSVENAFQWSKAYYAHDQEMSERLSAFSLPSVEAKQLGALVRGLPEIWGTQKVKVMLRLLTLKFAHPGLAGLLRKTKGFRLVEGNYWHDNFWGVCACRQCPGYGHNILGKQLEKIRESL